MNKTLISAYNFTGNYHSLWKGEENYIKTTTEANTYDTVSDYITSYLLRNNCTDEVIEVLNYILANNTQNNIHVVCDGSYRNAVILVRPDSIYFTHYPDKDYSKSIYNEIDYCLENCETLFLNMTDETQKTSNIYWDNFDEMYYDTEEDYEN